MGWHVRWFPAKCLVLEWMLFQQKGGCLGDSRPKITKPLFTSLSKFIVLQVFIKYHKTTVDSLVCILLKYKVKARANYNWKRPFYFIKQPARIFSFYSEFGFHMSSIIMEQHIDPVSHLFVLDLSLLTDMFAWRIVFLLLFPQTFWLAANSW